MELLFAAPERSLSYIIGIGGARAKPTLAATHKPDPGCLPLEAGTNPTGSCEQPFNFLERFARTYSTDPQTADRVNKVL